MEAGQGLRYWVAQARYRVASDHEWVAWVTEAEEQQKHDHDAPDNEVVGD